MPITFQGGQSMPAQGTAAYNALVGASKSTSGNVAGNYDTKTGNLTAGGSTVYSPIPVKTSGGSTTTVSGGGSSTPTPQKATVVTAQPAISNINNISKDFGNIQTGINTQITNRQANDAAQKAIPSMPGYNVSETPTSGEGVIKMTNNATGKDYYAVPLTQPKPNASDALAAYVNTDNSGGSTTNGGATPVPTDTSNTEQTNYQNSVDSFQKEQNDAYQEFKSQLESIKNGTFPLSTSEAALVDSTNQSFDRLRAQQEIANKNLEGGTAVLNARTGMDRYSPAIAMGNIAAAVSYGISKITDIDSQRAEAVAKLQQGFQDQDYKLVTAAYSAYQSLSKSKMDAVTQMHNDVIKQEQDVRNYQLDVQKFLTGVDQKNRELSDTEKKDLFDQNYKSEQLRLQYAGITDSNGNTINRTPVGVSPTGKIDTVAQKAFLDSLPPMTATTVEGLINYTGNPSNLSMRQPSPGVPSQRQAMLALAHQADPTFDENQYGARSKVISDFTSGKSAKNVTSLNTLVGHASKLANDVGALPNGDITKYNSVADWIAANTGKGATTAVITDLNTVAGEFATVLRGSGATDQEIANVERGVSLKDSPAQFKSFVETLTELMGSRLQALNDTYRAGVGKPPTTPLLRDSSVSILSKLKDAGYKIDIPGVNYSDPVAYAQASPDNAKALNDIHTQFPDLTPSQALQLINAQNQ